MCSHFYDYYYVNANAIDSIVIVTVDNNDDHGDDGCCVCVCHSFVYLSFLFCAVNRAFFSKPHSALENENKQSQIKSMSVFRIAEM